MLRILVRSHPATSALYGSLMTPSHRLFFAATRPHVGNADVARARRYFVLSIAGIDVRIGFSPTEFTQINSAVNAVLVSSSDRMACAT